jgi:protein SCO1/2
MIRIAFLAAAALVLFMAPPSFATNSSLLAANTATLSFHQHPGALLPLDATFRDETGAAQPLADYFRRGPVVLVLDYLHCRTLCGFVLQDLAQSLASVPQIGGRDYQIVAISIDPRDGPADSAAARAQYLTRFPAAGAAGWHFLTGTTPEIARVAGAEGFPFRYDAAVDQYAHPAGIVVAAPNGKIARYLLGVDYRPLDLKLALTEASDDEIAAPANALLLLCYCYDPGTGRYAFAIANAMRAAGIVTVLSLAAMIVLLARRHRRSFGR